MKLLYATSTAVGRGLPWLQGVPEIMLGAGVSSASSEVPTSSHRRAVDSPRPRGRSASPSRWAAAATARAMAARDLARFGQRREERRGRVALAGEYSARARAAAMNIASLTRRAPDGEHAQAQPGEDVAVVALGDRVPAAAVRDVLERAAGGDQGPAVGPGDQVGRASPRPARSGSRAGR